VPAELSYPDWLCGLWTAHVEIEAFVAPLGPFFVENDELEQAYKDSQSGEELSYLIRFARRGAKEGTAAPVVQDRPFNAVAELKAFDALGTDSECTDARYDEDNALLTVAISPLGGLRAQEDETQLELRTLASRSEAGPAGAWLTSELFEQRLRDGLGRDLQPPVELETLVMFKQPSGPGRLVTAVNRICKYAPAGSLGARLSGGAVISAFDYTWRLEPLLDARRESIGGKRRGGRLDGLELDAAPATGLDSVV
jgi:hypothetical protein